MQNGTSACSVASVWRYEEEPDWMLTPASQPRPASRAAPANTMAVARSRRDQAGSTSSEARPRDVTQVPATNATASSNTTGSDAQNRLCVVGSPTLGHSQFRKASPTSPSATVTTGLATTIANPTPACWRRSRRSVSTTLTPSVPTRVPHAIARCRLDGITWQLVPRRGPDAQSIGERARHFGAVGIARAEAGTARTGESRDR